jgi:hypothetical protein
MLKMEGYNQTSMLISYVIMMIILKTIYPKSQNIFFLLFHYFYYGKHKVKFRDMEITMQLKLYYKIDKGERKFKEE